MPVADALLLRRFHTMPPKFRRCYVASDAIRYVDALVVAADVTLRYHMILMLRHASLPHAMDAIAAIARGLLLRRFIYAVITLRHASAGCHTCLLLLPVLLSVYEADSRYAARRQHAYLMLRRFRRRAARRCLRHAATCFVCRCRAVAARCCCCVTLRCQPYV